MGGLHTAALAHSYDSGLVALSVFVAVLASYASLDLAGRVTSARGGARTLWLVGGAIAAMHDIGMPAFNLPIPVLREAHIRDLQTILDTGDGLSLVKLPYDAPQPTLR